MDHDEPEARVREIERADHEVRNIAGLKLEPSGMSISNRSKILAHYTISHCRRATRGCYATHCCRRTRRTDSFIKKSG